MDSLDVTSPDAITAAYADRLDAALTAVDSAAPGPAKHIATLHAKRIDAEKQVWLKTAEVAKSAGYYASIAGLVEARATFEALNRLAGAADYSAQQGDSPEATWDGLRDVVLQEVFRGHQARSTSVQSNEHDTAVHWAWIGLGGLFGLGSRW